jgi:hypothetical protein
MGNLALGGRSGRSASGSMNAVLKIGGMVTKRSSRVGPVFVVIGGQRGQVEVVGIADGVVG